MKKLFLLSALAITAAASQAANYQWVDGVFYDINTTAKTAAVAEGAYFANPRTPYVGDIVVPGTFEFNGETYTVTSVASYTFSNYDPELTSVSLPETIITLADYSFNETRLTELVIPNSVTTIGTSFAASSPTLKTVTIGSGVTTIKNSTFRNCNALTDVTVLATVPPTITSTVFGTTSGTIKGNITLHVPAGTVDTYKNAQYWDGFKEYVEIEQGPGVGVEGIEAETDGPARWFNLQGVELSEPAKGEIVIEVRGGKSIKRVIR